jgi:hypothetical protein
MPVVLRGASSAHVKSGKTELVEDRAFSVELDELNADESSLDRVQAAPFFVHRSVP